MNDSARQARTGRKGGTPSLSVSFRALAAFLTVPACTSCRRRRSQFHNRTAKRAAAAAARSPGLPPRQTESPKSAKPLTLPSRQYSVPRTTPKDAISMLLPPSPSVTGAEAAPRRRACPPRGPNIWTHHCADPPPHCWYRSLFLG